MDSMYEVSSITDHIDYGNQLPVSHRTIHMKAAFIDNNNKAIIHCANNLLNKYSELLDDYIIETTLTDDEFVDYKYKPKSLSLDMYGTTELWSSILAINNMDSVVEFNKKKIKLFRDDILEMLEEILILEEDNIRVNNHDMERLVETN